jgi:hypothetical protein
LTVCSLLQTPAENHVKEYYTDVVFSRKNADGRCVHNTTGRYMRRGNLRDSSEIIINMELKEIPSAEELEIW